MGLPNIKLNPFSRDSGFDAETMVSLTEEGHNALASDTVKNMKAFSILQTLDEHSPRSLSDLAKESRMNIFVTKNEVKKLKRQGMVKIDFRD